MSVRTASPPRPAARSRMLMVTSPMLSGPDVRTVQERLQRLGYSPGPIDGLYGESTAAAVVAFQIDYEIEVDGIVGPQTRQMLARAARRGRPKKSSAGGGPGVKALAEAVRHIGTRESPRGS